MWKVLFQLVLATCVVVVHVYSSEDLTPVEVFNLPNTHAGREFVVTFPPCIQLPSDDTVSFALEMFGFEEQVVTVESERSGYSETRTIAPFTIVRWELPQEVAQVYQHMSDADIRADAVYENAAVNVSTNKKLALTVSTIIGPRSAEYQAIPRESAWETHTALVLPEDSLALDHDTFRLPSHIAITGLEDNTEVRVLVFGDSTCLTNSGAEYGDTITRIINRGDVFLVSSGGRNANLQGTHIQSTIPIGVTISSYKSFTDEFGTYCDIGMEQVYSHEVNPGIFGARVSALNSDSVEVVIGSIGLIALGNPTEQVTVHENTVAVYSYSGRNWDSFDCIFDWYSAGLERIVHNPQNGKKSLAFRNSNGWHQRQRDNHTVFTGRSERDDSLDYFLEVDARTHFDYFEFSVSSSSPKEFEKLTSTSSISRGIDTADHGKTVISLRLPCNNFVQLKGIGKSKLYRKLAVGTDHIRTTEIEQFDIPYDNVSNHEFDVRTAKGVDYISIQVFGNSFGVSDYLLDCQNCQVETPMLQLNPRMYNIVAIQSDPKLPFSVSGHVFDRCIFRQRIEEIGDNCKLRADDPSELNTSYGDSVYFQMDLTNKSSQFTHVDSIWFSEDPAGFGFVDSSQLLPQTLAPGETSTLDLYFHGSEQFLDTTYLNVATNCYGAQLRKRLLGRTFNSPNRDCELSVVDSLECVRDSVGETYNVLVFRNDGLHPLRLDSLRLNSNSGALALERFVSNDSLVLLANDAVYREISFDRDIKKEVRDTLHVYYDCGNGHKEIVLFGQSVVSSVTPSAFVSVHAEVVPNSVGKEAKLYIQAPGQPHADVQIVNMLGQVYTTTQVNLLSKSFVDIPPNLSKGVWFAVVRIESTVVTVPFVR